MLNTNSIKSQKIPNSGIGIHSTVNDQIKEPFREKDILLMDLLQRNQNFNNSIFKTNLKNRNKTNYDKELCYVNFSI